MANKATRKSATPRKRSPTLDALRARLAEAEETLSAIRSGAVDALIVAGPNGEQVFTLQDAEQPYRLLVEEMNDGAAVLTPDGTLLYSNRRLADLLQVPQQDLMAVSFSRFVSESDHATFEALLRQGLKDASEGELSLQRADGALIPAHLSFNALLMHDQSTAGLIVADLTQQRRSEEVVAAEKLARSILEQAAEAIIVLDENGRVIRVNRMALALAGKNPLLQPFEVAFPLRLKSKIFPGAAAGKSASARAQDWFLVSSVLQGAVVRGLQASLGRNDQSYDLLLSAGPLLNPQNEILGGVVTLTDITAFEQTQEQLRFQANVLQNVRESVIVSDIQGHIVYWNEGASEVFGYSEHEMLGQSISLLYPNQSDEELAASLLDILQGRDYVGEWAGRRKDGSTVWVDIKTTLLRDADGRILGFLGVAKDITERRLARIALQTRARQQAAVAQLGQRALAGIPLQQLMDEAVQVVAQTLGNEYCKVLELMPDGKQLLLRAGVGWRAGLVGHATVGAGLDSQAGYTLQSDVPVIVKDLRTETRFHGSPLLVEHGVVSGMSCIIRGTERPFGVLGTHTTRQVEFTADDVHFLEAVANVLAEAIERERAETTLRESEERYRTVTETASDGIITIDEGGRILFVNSAAERIFGYTRDEMLGQPLTMLMFGEHHAQHRQSLQEYLQTGKRHVAWDSFEAPGLHKSGRRIELGLSFGEFIKDGQRIITGVVRDITARKAAERRLAAQYAISRILSESATIDEAIPQVLQAVCENLGWDLGVMWAKDREAERLHPANTWHAAHLDAQGFIAATCEATRARSEGLPGQAWASHAPIWVSDYHQRTDFARAAHAAQHGLRTALAFPIAVGGEVRGVVECFNRDSLPLDDDLLQMLLALGSQIGQFIERKRAEEEVRRQREQLQVTLSSIGDAVIATDIEGRVTLMNDVAQKLTGWTEVEARGQLLDDVFNEVDELTREPKCSRIEWVIQADDAVNQRTPSLLIARDGREIPIDDSAAPIRDRDGNIMGMVLVFRDITQRRAAEETNARLAAIVKSSYDAIIGKTLDGTIVSWNPGAERLYQYTAEEAIGKPITFIMPPNNLDEFASIMACLRRGESIEHYETTHVRKDGAGVDVSISVSPLRDGAGRIIGGATIARDISERRRAERAQAFLAQASEILSSSLNLEQTLQSVAQLALPTLADYCLICLGNQSGQVYQVIGAHSDPAKRELLQQIETNFLPDPENPHSLVTRVLRTGKAELMPDLPDTFLEAIADDPQILKVFRELSPRSSLFVPLIARDATLGVITLVYAESGRRYGDFELTLAEQLATRAALAIDNASLFQAEHNARAEAEETQQREAFLAEASSVLAGSLDYETTLTRVARLAVPILADQCIVNVVNENGAIRRVAAAHVHPAKERLLDEMHRRYPTRFTESHPVVQALKTGQAQLIRHLDDDQLRSLAVDDGHLELLRQVRNHSLMIVPIIGHERIHGTLTFGLGSPHRPYGPEELALAEALASRAALAIDNAHLYQAEQHARHAAEQAAARTAQLQAVTAALSEALTQAQVASTVVEHAMDALGAHGAVVMLLTQAGRALDILSYGGYLPEQLGARRTSALEDSYPLTEAVQAGVPLWLPSAAERQARYPQLAERSFLGADEAWAAIPLVVEGRVMGALGLSWAAARAFDAEDRDFMQALAQQCAQALERARLFEAEQAARAVVEAAHQRESFLAEASTLLASSLEYETTLASLARLIVPHLADWCTVHMLEEDGTIQQLALAHVQPEKVQWAVELQRRYPPNPHASYGVPKVLRTGQSEYVTTLSDERLGSMARDEEHWRLLRELGLRSYMVVPMKASGKTLGAISFVSAASGRRYGPEDVMFAEALTSRAALAVENARLYRHTQQVNAELEGRVTARTAELRAANLSLQSEIYERTRAEATVRSLLRISEKLNSTLELDTLLDLLAQEAIKLVDAERGCAGLREGHEMVARKYFDRADTVLEEMCWAYGQGLPGWVLQHKSPYLTNSPSGDPQILQNLRMNRGIRSVICTPILDVQGEVIGFFDIQNKRSETGFTQADEDLLMAISQTAAIAIQNAVAYQKIQQNEEQLRRLSRHLQSAREKERTRVAREIHDELGQVLTALKMDVAMLGRRFNESSGEIQRSTVLQEIKAMGRLIDSTIQSVREIITELRPEMLEDLGLKAAMEWQVQEFQTRTGIQVNFEPLVDEIALDHERAMALFRILQESLTNVARHAKATQVDVLLVEEDGQLVMRVQDNGRGIRNSEMIKAKSFGILGMRERALLLGGQLDISGKPGQGTTVTVRIPLNGDESSN